MKGNAGPVAGPWEGDGKSSIDGQLKGNAPCQYEAEAAHAASGEGLERVAACGIGRCSTSVGGAVGDEVHARSKAGHHRCCARGIDLPMDRQGQHHQSDEEGQKAQSKAQKCRETHFLCRETDGDI